MKNKKGIALILALFTLLFISLLVVAFLDMITIDQKITTNQIRDLQASFIADAGVERAIYNLRQDDEHSGTGGDVSGPAPGSAYNVVVSDDTITSTGTFKGFSHTLEVKYKLTESEPLNIVKIDTWKESD
jgi:Tfp pilus assembly protein PilX